MKNFSKDKLITFFSFFSYSGYYVGLGLMIFLGLQTQSRFYSVPLRVLLMLLMFYFILKNFKVLLSNTRPLIIFMVVSFWGLYFVKVFFSAESYELRLNWYEYIFYAAGYCVLPFLAFAAMNFKNFISVLEGIIYSGVALSILSLILYWDLLVGGVGRISMAQYEDPTIVTLSPLVLSYSAAITMVLSIIFSIYFAVGNLAKSLMWLIAISSSGMFFLGASRGSVVALFVSYIIIMFYAKMKSRIKMIVFGGGATFLLVFGAALVGSSVFDRVLGTQEDITTGDDSASRLYLWTDALTEFFHNPIVGGRIELNGIYPHNFIVEVLMSTGLVGFFLFMSVILWGLVASHKIVLNDKKHIWLLIFFAQGIVQFFFTGSIVFAIFIFMPLGIIISKYNKVNDLNVSRI